ncbi:hypothetical protein KEM52_003913 [Ascosphaera acerosa]|nr:hypothetical protein KEM52_003913 [Ascosphaera acerosa]
MVLPVMNVEALSAMEKAVPHAATAITAATEAPKVPEVGVPGIRWEEVGPGGLRALWTITVMMGIASLVFFLITSRITVQKRLPILLISLITTTSFFAYYAMATGDGVGYSFSQIHHSHEKQLDTVEGLYRATYWPRWINWTITSNITLFLLTLVSGLNGAGLLVLLASNTYMYIAAAFGAFGHHPEYKWGWYLIALFAYMMVFYQIFIKGRYAVMEKDDKARKFFTFVGIYYFMVSLAYPIIFGLGSYAHVLTVNAEVIIFAVLDFLSQGLLPIILVGSLQTIPAMCGCLDGFWTEGTNVDGSIRIEDDDDDHEAGRRW